MGRSGYFLLTPDFSGNWRLNRPPRIRLRVAVGIFRPVSGPVCAVPSAKVLLGVGSDLPLLGSRDGFKKTRSALTALHCDLQMRADRSSRPQEKNAKQFNVFCCCVFPARFVQSTCAHCGNPKTFCREALTRIYACYGSMCGKSALGAVSLILWGLPFKRHWTVVVCFAELHENKNKE